MDLVFSSTGARLILGAALNGTPIGDLKLKLFTNDITPDYDTIASDFTEAAGGGYAAKTLTSGSWTLGLSKNIAQATYADQYFTFTGQLTLGASIYGYFVTNLAGELIYSQRGDAFVTPANPGDYYQVVSSVLLQGME